MFACKDLLDVCKMLWFGMSVGLASCRRLSDVCAQQMLSGSGDL